MSEKISLDSSEFRIKVMQMDIGTFKYWLRIKGYRLEWFGTGTKNNPIKVRTRKRV